MALKKKLKVNETTAEGSEAGRKLLGGRLAKQSVESHSAWLSV